MNTGDVLMLKIKDSGGTVQKMLKLASSPTGALVWNGSQLADINDLTNYTTTVGLTTLLASYVLTMTFGAYSTTTQMGTAISTALAAYTTTASMTTLLATKRNTLDYYGESGAGSATILQG